MYCFFKKKHFFTCHLLQESHLCSVDPPHLSIHTLNFITSAHSIRRSRTKSRVCDWEYMRPIQKKTSPVSQWLCDVSAPTYILWFICDDERPTCGTRTLWLVPLHHVQTAWLSWGLGDREAIRGNASVRSDITSASSLFVDSFSNLQNSASAQQKCVISLVVFQGVWVQCVKVLKTE